MKYQHIKTLTDNVSVVKYQQLTCILKRKKKHDLSNEVRILKRLNKRNIRGVPKIICHDEDNLISSYQQGEDLFDYINNKVVIKLDKIKSIFKQVVQIVKEAHNQGIYHRDLKLENIIIEDNNSDNSTDKDSISVSIIDWEFAQKFGTKNLKLAGTVEYIAPEAVTLSYIGPENDIWSLGILLYYLLEGRFPWNIDDTFIDDPHYDKFLFELIYSFDINYGSIKYKEYIPLYKLIFVPYKERITLDQILCHTLLS